MWDEERELYDALNDQEADFEFIDDFTDVALDSSEIEGDAPEGDLDDESLYDEEDDTHFQY